MGAGGEQEAVKNLKRKTYGLIRPSYELFKSQNWLK